MDKLASRDTENEASRETEDEASREAEIILPAEAFCEEPHVRRRLCSLLRPSVKSLA